MSDLFVRELVQNALIGLLEEAAIFCARSAYSPFINELPDIAYALFDANGCLVAHTSASPLHSSALICMLPEVLKDYPLETLREADFFLNNDPFRGGIHPTDVGTFQPIFFEGRLVFIFCAMMFSADLGGMVSGGTPATATEVFHEGLLLPPVKLYDQGKPVDAAHKIIAANSRLPEPVFGDFRAVMAAGTVVASRINELIRRYGFDEINQTCQELMNYSERFVRQAIERVPNGSYRGTYPIGDDGVFPDKTYEAVVTITIEGSNCRIDCTGTSLQAAGAINSSYSQSLSAAVFALQCLVNCNAPLNAGFYKPLEFVFPTGTMVNPKFPGAANARMATCMAMIDAMSMAFFECYPERIVAPSGISSTYSVTGKDPKTDKLWGFHDVVRGPWGGRFSKDGIDAVPALFSSFSNYAHSIESYEQENPVLYRKFGLEVDSAGAGKFRGGCGLVKEVKFLTDVVLSVRAVDRYLNPPLGIAGGKPARRGYWFVNRGQSNEKELPSKRDRMNLRAGETLTLVTHGGGGYGDPLQRDPQRVAKDVKEGLVSIEGAASDYGVVIDAAGTVDSTATQRLRAIR